MNAVDPDRAPDLPAPRPESALNDVDDWFVSEVLPLEPMLVGLIRRHSRDADEVADLRQDVFIRVYEAGARRRPDSVKAFVLATARHLLIDRARRAQVVSIETWADLDLLDTVADELTPERHATGRQELKMLETAMNQLPPGCREVVALRKLDGLSQREVALQLGIAEGTVEKQIAKGMRFLADALVAKGVDLGLALIGKRRQRQVHDKPRDLRAHDET